MLTALSGTILTVLTGTLIYVSGQVIVKLVIDPVQELKKTIGQISHSLVELANVIANPGVPKEEVISDASKQLRNLSSQLHGHLYLIPKYSITTRIFKLPKKNELLEASDSLRSLSNSLYDARNEKVYEHNAKQVEKICKALSIYMPESSKRLK